MSYEPEQTDAQSEFRVAHCNSWKKFPFRQGLWIEDVRIPPGQECSNGSLILLAVVLWRIFYSWERATAGRAGQLGEPSPTICNR